MGKIKRLLTLLTCMITSITLVWAQELSVTGVVRDNTGETLPGVSVVVKGSAYGTVTNIDGIYELNVTSGSTLVFSYVGYQSLEVQVSDATEINVILNPSTVGLDELVVV